MSEIHNRTKIIHYREASFFKESVLTLQELLESAVKQKPLAKNRFQVLSQLSDDVEEREFINTYLERYGMFFGSFVRYEAGANKHTLTEDELATEFSVEQLAPPDTTDGKKRQFLDSILYFAVFGNHVVILQSSSLKTKEFERHLYWLLCNAGLLDNEQGLTLNQQVRETAKNKILSTPTKSLKIGTPLLTETQITEEQSKALSVKDTVETKRISVLQKGKGWAILDVLGLGQGSLGEQLEKEIGLNTNLEVRVEISYKRKAKGETQALMNGITQALRHTDPEDIEVVFKGAGRLKGDELILSAEMSLRYVNGLVDAEDFYLKVHDWIKQRIKDGILQA